MENTGIVESESAPADLCAASVTLWPIMLLLLSRERLLSSWRSLRPKVFERCFVADQRFGFAYCRTLSDEYRVDLLLLLKFSLQKRERNKDRARHLAVVAARTHRATCAAVPLTLRRIVFPGSSLRPCSDSTECQTAFRVAATANRQS